MKKLNVIAMIGLAYFLSACVEITPSSLEGKYLGTWSKPGSSELIPLTAEVQSTGKNSADLVLKCTDTKNPCEFSITVEKTKRSRANVDVSGSLESHEQLSFDSSESSSARPCLSSDSGELCISADQILLSLTDDQSRKNTFSLARINSTSQTAVLSSTPKAYALSELLKLAANYDFSTRIEYQRYLQSRYTAKAKLLAQLPHVNLGTVANALTGLNPASLISMVGDLLPFLLPNRWMKVREASLEAKAENISVAVIRLNAVLFSESLAFSYFRDMKTMVKLKSERDQIKEVYTELKMREDLGQLAYGTSLDILGIINSIDQAELQLNQSVQNELIAVGLSVGFTDPHAVLSLSDDSDRDIRRPLKIDSQTLEAKALNQSLEIEQADYLYHAARVARFETYFSWLDPQAAPELSIGAALFPAGKTALAQANEFLGIEEQIKAVTINKAAGLFINLDYAMKNQTLTDQAISIDSDRLTRVLNQLRYGSSFALADLVNAIQDEVTSTVNDLGNQALYQITEAQIDRLLLQGVYSTYNSSGPRVNLEP